MENKLNISVILPIKSAIAKDFDEYFDKCIQSVKTQLTQIDELIIVHTDETALVNKLNEYNFEDLNVVKLEWKKEPNFMTQVNFGIENSKNKWVSILEFDDEYSKIWFKNVKEYVDAYPDVDAFLPIVVDVDEKGMFVGFTNEATFAANFAQEMGYLTNDMLHDYQNFQKSGAVFNKEKLVEYGMFKSNMKLTFVYEFLLRMTYHSLKIMTIPRIGYKHMNLREGSIFWNYKNGDSVLTEDEVKFWVQSAKKEYFFTSEREIKYESEQS
jgi:glycosyltransferase involved in cell wall biosynthesis